MLKAMEGVKNAFKKHDAKHLDDETLIQEIETQTKLSKQDTHYAFEYTRKRLLIEQTKIGDASRFRAESANRS